MLFNDIKNNDGNKFYTTSIQEIEMIETELEILFPEELKLFYTNVGYGFIESKNGNINRIMDPESIKDFRYKENDFEFYQDIEIYDEFTIDKLVFFEANETTLLSIGFTDDNKGEIFYYDVKVADNLSDFLEKILNDEKYYFDMY